MTGAAEQHRAAYEPPAGRVVFAPGETAVARTPSLAEAGLADGRGISIDVVREHLPFLDDYVSVFASGSQVLGWNHHRSDLDVYVVTTSPVEIDRGLASDLWHIDVDTDPPTIHLFLGALGPFRSDVEFWLESQIDQIVDSLPAEREVSDSALNFPAAQRDFLHKLEIAVPLAGDEWLRPRQERVRRSGVARVIAVQSMVRTHGFLEDTEGCVSSGDLRSALLMVQEAFKSAVDALLLAYGDLADTKWTARRLEAIRPDELSLEEYWATVTMAGYRPDDPSEWVVDTARRCHRLLIGVTSRFDARARG